MLLSHVPSNAPLARATSVGRFLFLHANKTITTHCRQHDAQKLLVSQCSNLLYLRSLVRKTKEENVGHRSCTVFTALPAPQFAASLIVFSRKLEDNVVMKVMALTSKISAA
ncbi:hypothetical protein AVEN_191739-1 [Araneus ventricosus]|uniref:Uncharacterized protein n=1 Tax=Araneus ventricosus TaxID=182803 RepID=A0A4Y2NDU4_ARAVE|nr:hypothetical protein AVEN_191739-1 [Araneus ventricosus]